MRRECAGLLAVFLTIGLISVSSADVILLGVFEGNDSQVGLETLENQITASQAYIDSGGEEIDLVFYAKVDAPDEIGNLLTVVYDEGNMTGTWSTEQPIDFYTVKGGNEYAVWWIQEGADSGIWTTEGLINGGGSRPAISHLSAYNNRPTNVPEPSILSLLGISLLVYAGVTRRRKN